MRPIVAALALVVMATTALGADRQILGSQLVVKNPSTADERSFAARAKEVSSPNAIVGNPTLDGATLTVRAEGDNPSAQTFLLPQGTAISGKPFWSASATSGFMRGKR